MKTLRQLTAEREALARREDRLTAQIQRKIATEESPVVEPAPTRPKKFALHPVTPAERARSTAHLCDYIFGAFLSDKGAAKLRELLAAKELSEDEGALLTYLRSF